MHIKKFLSFFYQKDSSMPNWEKLLPRSVEKNEKKKNILIAISAGGLKSASIFESLMAVSLNFRGHNIEFLNQIFPYLFLRIFFISSGNLFSKTSSSPPNFSAAL